MTVILTPGKSLIIMQVLMVGLVRNTNVQQYKKIIPQNMMQLSSLDESLTSGVCRNR